MHWLVTLASALLCVAAAGLDQALGPPAAAPASLNPARATAARAGSPASATQPKVDPCALLSAADIRAVQGEAVRERKPSEQPASAFRLLQCFYVTATYVKSVSLALAVSDPATAGGPRTYWRERFHPARGRTEPEPEEEASGETRRESGPPVKIMGLGEEAFWVGNRIMGALYVLKGNAFLRISVGGEEDESVRITKTKTLAQKALKRLDRSR